LIGTMANHRRTKMLLQAKILRKQDHLREEN
jgi:hypothetical protein